MGGDHHRGVTDEWTTDESTIGGWDPDAPEEPYERPRWRRPFLAGVGALVAAAMLAVPVWNVVDGLTPELSDDGLELCGFDYCIVQDAVGDAGYDLTMARLTHTILDEEQASALADALVARLAVAPVTVEVVDRIDRRIAGQYDPSSRRILLERPARAWIVVHEVAHTVANGHGADFQDVVIELAEWMESTGR
jgi:hypothetical protein